MLIPGLSSVACVRQLQALTLSGASQESLIAWTYDRDHFYSPRIPHNWNDAANVGHQIGGNTSTLPLKEQQHFMVWMRPSATPAVKKLYAVIHQDIPAGVRPVLHELLRTRAA